MSLSGLTEKDEAFITIEAGNTWTKTDDFYTILQLEYYVLQDLKIYNRSAYTLFSVLCDVGGLSSILVTLAAGLMWLLTFQKFENKLVEQLY